MLVNLAWFGGDVEGVDGTFKGCGSPLYFKSKTLNMTRLEAVATDDGMEGKVWRAKATPVRYPVKGQEIIGKNGGWPRYTPQWIQRTTQCNT